MEQSVIGQAQQKFGLDIYVDSQ
ncbi:hypothetical protein CCACVL1_00491, partial [Corchorus capsularis]